MIFSEEQQRRLGELGATSEDLQAGFADSAERLRKPFNAELQISAFNRCSADRQLFRRLPYGWEAFAVFDNAVYNCGV